METVKSFLEGGTVGLTRADAHNPVVVETDKEIHKQVKEATIQARATHTHMNLHVTDWVATQWEEPVFKATINWISNQKVQNLKHLLMQTLRREWLSFKSRKIQCSIRSPLLPPYMSWKAGRSYVINSHHGSLSNCYEWMSLRCWTPGSAANAVPAAGLVLVAWHSHTEAESDQQLQMMHLT